VQVRAEPRESRPQLGPDPASAQQPCKAVPLSRHHLQAQSRASSIEQQ
jgi:hypothetical protein